MHIVLSKDAHSQYKKLPKPEQAKIKKKLTLLLQNPYEGKKLGGELKGKRSLRAWPYRILYTISEQAKRIEVHKIAHRQGAYN